MTFRTLNLGMAPIQHKDRSMIEAHHAVQAIMALYTVLPVLLLVTDHKLCALGVRRMASDARLHIELLQTLSVTILANHGLAQEIMLVAA